MRLLITGGKGMLGRTLQQEFSDCDIVIADLPEADITDAAGFDAFLARSGADVVIHCAAMTAVDRCESEAESAFLLNAVGSGNVAASCQRHQVRLIAFSTDYVFSGDLDRPYHEFDLADGGKTVYGRSKFAGEELIRQRCPDHVICRIAWLYGAGGPSFVHTMMKLADGSRAELKVVNDQWGNPTSAVAVTRHIRYILANSGLKGTFHLTCEGETTWAGFAREIFQLAGIDQRVVPCRSDEFFRPASRPKNSRLDNARLRLVGLPTMPDWHEALAEFMNTEKFYR